MLFRAKEIFSRSILDRSIVQMCRVWSTCLGQSRTAKKDWQLTLRVIQIATRIPPGLHSCRKLGDVGRVSLSGRLGDLRLIRGQESSPQSSHCRRKRMPRRKCRLRPMQLGAVGGTTRTALHFLGTQSGTASLPDRASGLHLSESSFQYTTILLCFCQHAETTSLRCLDRPSTSRRPPKMGR